MLYLKNIQKLIHERILEIQDLNDVKITRQGLNGWKKRRRTYTLSVEIQSFITQALNGNKFGLVTNLCLSAAFDKVNIDQHLKRFKKIVFQTMS